MKFSVISMELLSLPRAAFQTMIYLLGRTRVFVRVSGVHTNTLALAEIT